MTDSGGLSGVNTKTLESLFRTHPLQHHGASPVDVT